MNTENINKSKNQNNNKGNNNLNNLNNLNFNLNDNEPINNEPKNNQQKNNQIKNNQPKNNQQKNNQPKNNNLTNFSLNNNENNDNIKKLIENNVFNQNEKKNKGNENENEKKNNLQLNVENNINKRNESIKGMFSASANKVSKYAEDAYESDTFMLVLKIILGAIFLIVLIQIIKYFYIKWDVGKISSPLLVNGSKNAKHAMVISQDPSHTNYVPISRSINKEGIEFSYSVWFLVTDFSYKKGEWKHIFHKGNSSSYPNRAPGVWLHPDTNSVRIYMNTIKNMLEYVDIDNIPLRKWVHLTIVVKNRFLNVYVNGFLKIRKELSSLPRQNYGNVWVNMYGGFEGYVSRLQYFDRAIEGLDVDRLVSAGPDKNDCIDTNEKPPYLDDSWWIN